MSDLPPHRTRRISLTKAQLRTELGAELLSLCESITSDGQMAAEEVSGLRQWLEDSAASDMPAATYLREVVQRIIADGKITREECRDLYRAVETVLPPEVRRVAVAARRDVESKERSERKTARAAEIEHERAERLRNTPIARANFMVAGCRYEGRPNLIWKHAHAGDEVKLVRDLGNRFSTYAIAVVLQNGKQIGFVPEEDAGELAPLIDQGAKPVARITKILTGGRSPIPVVDAQLYSADSAIGVVADTSISFNGAALPEARKPSGNLAMWWILGACVILATLVLLRM